MNFKLFILAIISGILFSAEPPNPANSRSLPEF